MTYKMFIDDERFPITNDWVIVRSSKEAINYIKRNGMPIEIAFDHDLGGDDTSGNVIRWMVNALLDKEIKIPNGFKYSVHSMNPIGKKWIEDTMREIVKEFK